MGSREIVLIAVAFVIGAVSLWQVLEGIGLIGWGLFEAVRQAIMGSR